MRFEAGESGNPNGRPKGSYGGRIQALAGLDKLLARKKNQQALIAALEKDLQKDPVRFFKTVIMPLLPKESKLSFDHDGIVEWRSLLGVTVKLKDGKLVTEEPATIEGEVVPNGEDLSSKLET
jgi:hypothetical protein